MIEVKDLHKSYGKLDVLRGITETIQDQEVVCVIGLPVRAKAPSFVV